MKPHVSVKWLPGMSEADFYEAMAAAGFLTPGTLTHMIYRHDDDCPKLRGYECRCDPDVEAFVHSPQEKV